MSGFNKVILLGNLTRDPEIKFLESGVPVCNFGIAINKKYNDKNTGETKESVCFIDIEAWNRQAEIIDEYFSKGKPIMIEGELKFEQWEDKDGSKRSKIKVWLQSFQFVGRRDDDDSHQSNAGGRASSASSAPKEADDKIPF